MLTTEASDTFACFGSQCAVLVLGDAGPMSAADAVQAARTRLLSWHVRFTRFDASSELSQLNADPRETVPVSREMACFAQAVLDAARASDGLVDATLLTAIQEAGYRTDLRTSLPLPLALKLAPARRPGRPRPEQGWRSLSVDAAAGTVTRPPGLLLDSGGIVKGLAADLVAEQLAGHSGFAVDCAGDLRIGGAEAPARQVNVASPFDAATLHTFTLGRAGIATSGIGRRSWLDRRGRPAHHLLDPATGRPAFTGVVQATAIAPTALEAETRSKSAILAGPLEAPSWLPHGGVLVFDDGSHVVVDPA